MKCLSVLFTSLLIAAQANAYQVVSAKLDAAKENILVQVRYGGGCEEHDFELVLQGCAESYPAQCRAKIEGTTKSGNPDFCEAMVTKTVTFNIHELGLDDSYYSRASLRISGTPSSNGKALAAVVRLPEVK